jgi:hypothetical protein
VSDEINFVSPNAAPLLALTSKLRDTRQVSNWKYWIMEQDDYPRFVTVSSDAGTTINVNTNDGNRLPAGALLRSPKTGEIIYVTTPAASALTVVRGIGDTAQETLAAGDILEWFSAVSHEFATLPTIKSIPESEVYNYPQIIRTPFGTTGRAAQMALRGGSAMDVETRKATLLHKQLIEKTFFFSGRDSFTDPGGSGYLVTITGGLKYFIGNNYVWDLNGNPIEEAAFFDWAAEFLRYGEGGYRSGSPEKFVFLPSIAMAQIDRFAREKIQVKVEEKVYGVKVRRLELNLGTLNLMHAPALDEYMGDSLCGFGVDLNHVRKVTFKGRNTKLMKGREANDVDGKQSELFSDLGLEVSLPEAHCYIKNIGS